MRYKIFDAEGNHVNSIVADEAFVEEHFVEPEGELIAHRQALPRGLRPELGARRQQQPRPVFAGAQRDLFGFEQARGRWTHAGRRGGAASAAGVPRATNLSPTLSRYHSAWCVFAQPALTVPCVIARSVPLTQIAA